jgi:hypothetical protein
MKWQVIRRNKGEARDGKGIATKNTENAVNSSPLFI